MADKPTIIEQDYGHRTYMHADDYTSAMKRPSDKQYDNRIKRPHSDDKKPYMDDEYPEMEHYWTPYDPPTNFVPPGIPDDWKIPPHDAEPPGGPGDLGEPGFTGCLFGIPRGPSSIKKGETTFSGIGVLPEDLLIRLYVNYGPAELLSSYQSVNASVLDEFPNTIVSAKALDSFDPNDYHEHETEDDAYAVQIAAVTASGGVCTWEFSVIYCPATVELEWDWDNSAETIVQDATAAVFVTGGAGPFDWEVSGEGYTLSSYSDAGRSNTLIAGPSSCGSAIITVTDGCGIVVTGSVRNTTGYWDEKASQCGLVAAASWDINCSGSIFENLWPVTATVVVGYQKQYHKEVMRISSAAQSGADTDGECEADRAAYNCGSWTNPCLPYPGSWTLTKPPGTCGGTIRWQGIYEECSSFGQWTTRPCHESGGKWYFLRAQHNTLSMQLRYWEWECA